MAGIKSKPTFLILPNKLPSADLPDMIGRFVTNINNPIANSHPKDPSTIIGASTVQTVEQEAKVTLSTVTNDKVKVFLEGLFTFKIDAGDTSRCTVDSAVITTYRLQDEFLSFDKLIETPRVYEALTGPRGLFRRNEGRLYFIVGIKTCQDGKSNTTRRHRHDYGVSFSVPLAAAFGLPVSVNPGASIGTLHSKTSSKKGTLPGEYIFAVEYKRVTQRSIFGYSSNQPVKVAKDPISFEWDNATFHNSNQEAPSFDDDDDVIEPAPSSEAEQIESPKENFGIAEVDTIDEDIQSAEELKGWL